MLLLDNKINMTSTKIYTIEPNKIKKIINDCYCKYVSKKRK